MKENVGDSPKTNHHARGGYWEDNVADAISIFNEDPGRTTTHAQAVGKIVSDVKTLSGI